MNKYSFTPIKPKEYTKLIKNASYTTFYNSPERLTFIQKRNRKTGLFKISKGKSVVALAAYQIIPARSGSFIYFQHSPVFIDTRTSEDSSFWDSLKDFAYQLGKKEDAIYVRFTPRVPQNSSLTAELLTSGYKKSPVQDLDSCVTRVININEFTEDSLSRNKQDQLEKVKELNLEVNFATTKESLEDFAAIYRTLAAKKQIDFVPLDYLKEELTTYLNKGHLIIAEVKDSEGTLYSGASIVVIGDRAWYYWAATTEKGLSKSTDVLMLTETIKFLHKEKVSILDLWGGAISKSVENKGLPHPWREMDKFKQEFGATRIEYLPAIDITIKRPQYMAAQFYQRAIMMKRGYPYLPLKD